MAQKVSSIVAAGVANNLSDQQYILWTDPGVEPTIENEEQLQSELFQIVQRTQQKNFSMHRRAFRGTHVKTQGVVQGTFTVEPDLPARLARGICSPENAQQSHPVVMRYANEPSFLQDDREPGPRGCGLKIFNVSGTGGNGIGDGGFLDPIGAKVHTQDLTFNNAPLLELRDLPTTVEIFQIREAHFREPEKIPPELKKRKDASLQLAPAQLPNQHFASYTMYSQSAFRWGDHVVKYALFPTSELQEKLGNEKVTDGSDPEQHSKWLQEFFASNDATYDLRVQLLQNLSVQPVEDTSVPWDETAFPFQTVGKIVFPKGQNSFSDERRTFWEDSMRLNVWYGLEEHRPLGSVNRLRRRMYEVSEKYRQEKNVRKVIDLDNIEQVPE